MGKKHAPIAKISPPENYGIVPRERLFWLLDGARKGPVVWVSGPAGAGKTTLVTSYLDSRKVPCLWYCVDAGDGDLASFFYYLGLAAEAAEPGKKQPLPFLTPEYLSDVPAFSRRFFERLFIRLGPARIIVFDNVQEAPAGSAFYEALLCGLNHVPPGFNVFLLSRHGPPASLARLRAEDRCRVVGWEEISLTPGESREIAAIKGGVRLSSELAAELHSVSGGWAAGLVLMIDAMRAGDAPLRLAGRPSREEIFDYFAAELFDRADEETRDFLLKTSFMPRMTCKAAEKLTGTARAASLLSRLYRDNFFTSGHSELQDAYHYHPLFREFLQARARDLLKPEEISSLRRNSAKLLAEAGLIEDAAALYRECGDAEGLVTLLLKHAPLLAAQGRTKTLFEWLEAVPAIIVESSPWLLYWRGTCLFTFNPAESLALFERALRAFRAAGDAGGAFLAWAGAVNSVALGSRKTGSLGAWFSILDELVAEYEFPSEQVEPQVLSAAFLAASYEQGCHAMDKWVERVFAPARGGRAAAVRAQALSGMAMYLMMRRGEIARAAVAVDLLRAGIRSREAPPMARIAARLTEAVYLEFTASHRACLAAVNDGLKTGEAADVHIMDYLLLGQAALSCLNTGDVEAAGEFIGKMAPCLASAGRHHTAFYHFLSACLALRRNDGQQASPHIDMSIQLFTDLEIFQGQALNYLVKAQINHALGQRKKALETLARSARIGRKIRSDYIEFSCLLAGACFSFAGGREAAGMSSLGKAMTLGRAKGLYLTFIYLPSVPAGLCAKALVEGLEPEYARELIERCRLRLEDAPSRSVLIHAADRGGTGSEWMKGLSQTESWPWFLRIRTLGRFQFIREGRPVTFGGKVQQRPIAMLQALIAFGGDADAGRLCDALWPDADGDAARRSFKFTLHRLRRLLGRDDAVRMRGGRVTLEQNCCFVDAWAFERLCAQAEDAFGRLATRSGKGAVSGLTALVERALALYKGDFLADESGQPWTHRMRERLKSRFIRLVELAGSCHEKAGEWEKAARYYRMALEANDLQEEFYRGLMRCCQRLGRPGEALALYNRCRAALSETLGLEPSEETAALYQRLLKKK